MNRMQSLGIVSLITTLHLLGPMPIAAAMDPETGALVAGGVLAAFGLGTVAMTQSSLRVDVDVYRDTLPINLDVWNRTDGFRLGKPTVLRQLVNSQSQVSPDLSSIYIRLCSIGPNIDNSLTYMDKSISMMERNTNLFSEVLKYVKARRDGFILVSHAINEYNQYFLNKRNSQDQDTGGWGDYVQRIETIQHMANELPGKPPEALVQVLRSQIYSIIRPVNGDVSKEFDTESDVTKLLSLAESAITNAKSTTIKISEAKRNLDNLFYALGLSPATNVSDLGMKDLLQKSSYNGPDGSVKAKQDLASILTFSCSATVGANLGPVVNEVIQEVLTKNQYIDTMLEEDRWCRYNYAFSLGGQGKHNAIVYLDNMVTPIIKRAEFDPGDIIKGTAELYKQAFSAFADVYGVSIPAKGTDETIAEKNVLNVFAAKQKRGEADRIVAEQKEDVLQVFKSVINLKATVLANAPDSKKWNGVSAGDQKASRTQAVEDVVKALNQLADELAPAAQPVR